jgi:hypothetical protein
MKFLFSIYKAITFFVETLNPKTSIFTSNLESLTLFLLPLKRGRHFH